jgi:hypothetical protein
MAYASIIFRIVEKMRDQKIGLRWLTARPMLAFIHASEMTDEPKHIWHGNGKDAIAHT